MKEVTIKMSEKELAEVNRVLSALGKKIVPEELKRKTYKTDIEPEEPFNYTDEGPTAAEINSGGTVFIHSSYFDDANIDEDSDPHMYANKTNIYLTDLRKDEIDWQGEEVEYWGTTARNLAGDLPLDLDGVWCVNPYGDTCTINVSDHIINIHYTGDGVEEDEEEKFPPKEFTVATDAEGRATIRKEILEASNLLAFVDTWFIFTNDDGTKMYITWKSDPYLIFNKEEARRVKEIERYGKTALRIKLGKPYTNYKVTTTGEEDNELITIHLDSGYQIECDDEPEEETDEKIKDYAKQKADDKRNEELAERAVELIQQIFGDVEKIRIVSGVDLTDIIAKVVKAILSGKKVF